MAANVVSLSISLKTPYLDQVFEDFLVTVREGHKLPSVTYVTKAFNHSMVFKTWMCVWLCRNP